MIITNSGLLETYTITNSPSARWESDITHLASGSVGKISVTNSPSLVIILITMVTYGTFSRLPYRLYPALSAYTYVFY